MHSQQSRYGYVIGTRGVVTSVETGGSSTAKTAPVDHVEGVAQGDSLKPFSLYLNQKQKRLQLPAADAGPDLSLYFPVHAITLAANVTFGDSANIPAGSDVSWS